MNQGSPETDTPTYSSGLLSEQDTRNLFQEALINAVSKVATRPETNKDGYSRISQRLLAGWEDAGMRVEK